VKSGVRNIFFAIFALSGFSGLIYESIWTHYLKLFLGHAAYAQTLVLAIFMGGMALGSWVCSRYAVRWKNLLVAYAVTEGAIGLSALLFHNAFDLFIEWSYIRILPSLQSTAAVDAFKWTFSAFLILPQTVLLGMTFPLMSMGILRIFPDHPGRSISLLYFTNSIGAAVGVIVSGFVLVRFTGLPGTIRTAGMINIALAFFVWILVKRHGSHHPIAGEVREDTGTIRSIWNYRFLLFVSLVTGVASFIYEIGWIRMLSLVLGSSTRSFELMLAAFILGLALGGLWIQRRIDSIADPAHVLMILQIIMGGLALSTLLLYGNTFRVMKWLLGNLEKTAVGYALFGLSSHGIALAVMLPTTFCAGTTLPLITYTLLNKGHGEKSIGAVYAANTLGAILGVFLAVHVGMPYLGLKGLITLGGSLDIALGLALLWGVAGPIRRAGYRIAITMGCVTAVVAIFLLAELDPYKMVSGVYRDGILKSPEDTKIYYHKDGKTSTVSVTGDMAGFEMAISTNGKTDAAIRMHPGLSPSIDEPTMTLLAVLPMALNPRAKYVANIGWGSGITTHTLMYNKNLSLVDTVEIEPNMYEAARYFGFRVRLAYSDPRSRIHIDDAKTFFSAGNNRYDIIISEPSNPWVSGVSGLFSREFYRLVKRHLSDDGIFCQWVQLYEIDLDLVFSILKAVSANFSDFALYSSNETDLLILCRKQGQVPSMDRDILRIPEIEQDLKRIKVNGIQDIELRYAGNKKAWSKFLDTEPIGVNSDYWPILDQYAERARFLKLEAKEITAIAHTPLPLFRILSKDSGTREGTNITPTKFIGVAQNAISSMTLRDNVLGRNQGVAPPLGAGNVPDPVIRFRKSFRESARQVEESERLANIYNVGAMMVTYLNENELDLVWKTLESGAKEGALTPTEREWISLFKAVGRRDPKAMANVAETLLNKNDEIPLGPRKYLVATAMLGSVVQNNKEKSMYLWKEYGSRLFETGPPNLLFRLLLAHSAE